MMILLTLRLVASGYLGLVQWWLAMQDGIVTLDERGAIVRAVLLVECRALRVAKEAVAVILRG